MQLKKYSFCSHSGFLIFGLKVLRSLNEQRTHFALAFELPGGWHKLKDAMVLTVLQVLMILYIYLIFLT